MKSVKLTQQHRSSPCLRLSTYGGGVQKHVKKMPIASSMSMGLELVQRPDFSYHYGTIRFLDDSRVNLDQIREWIARGIEIHGDECNKTVGIVELTGPQLLINIVQGCIDKCG